MKDVELWLSLYTIGVMVAALMIVYDLRKIQDEGHVLMPESINRIAILLLWSWAFVYFRFSVWLMDYVTYWYVKLVFKYKVWKNKRKK